MGTTTLIDVKFVVGECATRGCDVPFVTTVSFDRQRRNDHAMFYCPRGHQNYYPQKSDEEKLRDELEEAQRQAITARNSRDVAWNEQARAHERAMAAERSRAAVKGHLTRMRNKVANGICPVPNCRRHFENVSNHLRTEHEGWLAEHDVLIESA